MSYKDNSWFERNEGFISFMGHLAAIEQRNAVIQQLAASNSLQWDIARTQQRIAAQERDQQQRRDTLYDINQAAILIEAHYSDRPEQAKSHQHRLWSVGVTSNRGRQQKI